MSTTLDAHRALVDRLPLVTYMVRLEPPSRAVFVSPQVEALLGFLPEDFDSPHFWEQRMVPEDLTQFRATFAELRRDHGRMSVEYRIAARDGREVWVRDVGVVDRGDDGELYVHGYLTDVTREKELERALAAERAQADAFFRDSPTGMGITDAAGRYLTVNDALARMNGVSVAEQKGRTLAEVAPEMAAQVSPLLEQVRRTGEAVFQQEVSVERDGKRRTYLASYFAIEVEGETRYGRIVTDITRQRRAEEQYRRLIESLPLVTYVNSLAPERRSTYVSPQIEELYGFPVSEWLEDPELLDRVVHPDDVAQVTSLEQAARERNGRYEHEYRIVRADGAVRWVLDIMDAVPDADGKPYMEQGFVVDVTERKESEQLFRAVFDSAFEGVAITNEQGIYVDVNPRACEILGRTRDELVGTTIGVLSEALLAGGSASGQSEIVRPDGTVRDIEYSARANVLPGLHVSVLRDVTERKQLEHDLWRAQRLESVGRLAGGVAQDFNNMLTAIRGYAQLLLARAETGSIEHHHAEEIDRAADRAATLTAQLLAFGRRQVLQTRPVELNRLVENLAEMLARLAGDEVELAFELDSAAFPIRVDPAQIEQAIVNLVVNAAEVTAPGGRVVIRTGNADSVSLDQLREGCYATVSVEDAGAGIEDSALEHLFEPFFTTKSVGEGVGLGLATAYGIAKQSGGTISVSTAAGAGSTFTLYLPAASVSRETVVVVESDPAVRDVLFEVLSDAGYRTVTAPTPTAALRLAEGLPDGIDLLVTELDEEAANRVAEALGAAHSLTVQKPYSPEDLRAAVGAALHA